jgi:hypothetical protein
MSEKVSLTFVCSIEDAELMIATYDLLGRRKAGSNRLSPGTIRAFPTIFDELSKIVAKAGHDAMAVGIDYMGGSYPLLEGFANMCRAKQSGATFRVNVSSR